MRFEEKCRQIARLTVLIVGLAIVLAACGGGPADNMTEGASTNGVNEVGGTAQSTDPPQQSQDDHDETSDETSGGFESLFDEDNPFFSQDDF